MMLLAADFTVVFNGHPKQFIVAVSCALTALFAESLHLRFGKSLESCRDTQILMQHVEVVHAADRHGDRQTHRVGQRLLRSHISMTQHFAAAAETLHSERGY